MYVCWFMCVLGKFPVRFQFYRTKCQSRKLRHVMFCNICIKNPNLRKILIFPRFIRSLGCKKPTAASRENAVGFDHICGMHVGLQGLNCLVLCGFIKLNPHKVGVTVSGTPLKPVHQPNLERPKRNHSVAEATSLQNPQS